MPIKATEVGKIFRYATYFDLSAFTSLSLKFTFPDGTENIITNPRVTAPAVDVVDPDLGLLTANTYMQFTTLASDFPQAFRDVVVCGTYEDATPKTFFGDDAFFDVLAPC